MIVEFSFLTVRSFLYFVLFYFLKCLYDTSLCATTKLLFYGDTYLFHSTPHGEIVIAYIRSVLRELYINRYIPQFVILSTDTLTNISFLLKFVN